MTLAEITGRLRAWLRRDRLARELADEMQSHIELIAEDLVHRGMSRDEALAAARRQLGHATSHREASREYWGFHMLDSALQDVRYALRGLIRSPGFTATVVITLALGIGANAAMFAVIDRLMFRPYPFLRDPSTVHRVYLQSSTRDRRFTRTTIPYTRFLDLKRETHSFSQYVVVSEWRLAVGTGQDTRVRKVVGASSGFFELFDAPPAQGRYFNESEDSQPLGAFVAVMSHSLWRTAFGAKDVIGLRLQIGSLPYTVIGVAPAGFTGAVSGKDPEFFVPNTTIPANIDRSNKDTYSALYNWDWVEMLVRRKPGVSEASATADLTAAYIKSRNVQRAINPRVTPDSIAKPAGIAGPLRSAAGPDAGLESRVLLWVSGVAGIVLLIACANVANLMLARVLRRRREIAVRLALGVSRTRLMGQFIIEGVLLATLGGIAGMFTAQWVGIGVRGMLLPEGSSFNLGTDWRTLGFAAACAAIAALLTVIGPAVLATRPDLAASIKAGAREGTYRRSRTRSALLVMQGALSVALLVGAGLFVRSLNNILSIPLGYDATTVVEAWPDFRGAQLDSAAGVAIRRRLLETAKAIPGVEAATRVNGGLYGTNTTSLRVPGIDSVERLGRFNFQITTPDYFKVMQTHIVRGRGFDARDGEGTAPVVVVSAAMAHVLWPGADPLGKCIQVIWNPQANIRTAPCVTVVGVAEDAAYQGVTDEERFMYYMNADQIQPGWSTRLYLRMRDRRVEFDLERVRQRLQAAMPGDGFVVIRPLQEVVDDQRRSWRLGATLFVAFGGLALVVAAVGLYGVIGYNVAQRMHELGVRVALGARSLDIVRLVVSQGLAFAAAGVTIGLALAALAARWIQPLLYKESARDPVAYAVVGAVMVLVGIVASGVPAVRAARADPNRALRTD